MLRVRLESGEFRLPGRDGQRYLMRPIRPSDAPLIMRSYEVLSERSKWFRFLHAVPHLTEKMAAGFCSPNPETEVCVVIEGEGPLDGEIIGGARVVGVGPGRAAEFATTLRPEARGLGLARQALETLFEIAREDGCVSVWGSVSKQNEAMLRLSDRLGLSRRRDPDDGTLILAERAF